MLDDSDYELLPHEELENLRKEVERIKGNPLGKKYGGEDLVEAIHDLTKSVDTMNRIFETANKEMVDDFKTTSIKEHFKLISSQNEQIATGIVTVAELIQKQTELLTQTIESLNAKKNELEDKEREKEEEEQKEKDTTVKFHQNSPNKKFEDSNAQNRNVIGTSKTNTEIPDIPPLDLGPLPEPKKKKGLFG